MSNDGSGWYGLRTELINLDIYQNINAVINGHVFYYLDEYLDSRGL